MQNSLRVMIAGPLTTIQDLGRLGYERFGVPQSGPMDTFALRAANQLVGNAPDLAGLEIALEGPQLKMEVGGLVAGAGCGWTLNVGGRAVGLWRAARVFAGETIQLIPQDVPGWGYLAVLGGIATPLVMGSRSTYIRGRLGGVQGRALQDGDLLPMGEIPPGNWLWRAGRWLAPEFRPNYAAAPDIPVLTGPQAESFMPEAVEMFLSSAYLVSPTSDRMGYRLSGPRLAHSGGADLISEPMPSGAMQVPADGLPIAMMADQPTTGGYPKIAVVTRSGMPLLAQAMPGHGRVRFRAVDLEQARDLYRAQMGWLANGIEEVQDDEWSG